MKNWEKWFVNISIIILGIFFLNKIIDFENLIQFGLKKNENEKVIVNNSNKDKKNKEYRIACTITSASNTKNGEIFDTSSWEDRTWFIDTNNKIVRSEKRIEWDSEFEESKISWRRCYKEHGQSALGIKPSKTCYENFIDRGTFSYTECLTISAWICEQRHKGSCKITKENQL
jgi:hypothetical protein